MATAQGPGTCGPVKSAGAERKYEPVTFTATCLLCAREQPQRGFSRATLQRLLSHGLPIEAYCVTCDQFWPMSGQARTALSEALGQAAE